MDMDEATLINLTTYYDAMMKTNYDYGKNIYFYVLILVIIFLGVIIILLVLKPCIKYVPIYVKTPEPVTVPVQQQENFTPVGFDNFNKWY